MENNSNGFISVVATIFLLVFSLIPSTYAAQTLTLNDVLLSANSYYPDILAAQQELQQARADRLYAQGAFDIELQQNTRARTSGYYDGLSVAQKVIKPLRYSNAKLFAEYRISDGQLPIYEDEFVTLDRGEFSMGVSLSLLRDGDIDKNRLALINSDLNVDMEELRQETTINNIGVQAAIAYLNWVNAHKQLEVYQSLLKTAKYRHNAIQKRVILGSSAEIELLDNEQNILKRHSQVLNAENELELTSIGLSMYWRDQQGHPKKPSAEIQPPKLNDLAADIRIDMNTLITDALLQHPEIQQIENALKQTENTNRFHRNQLLPNLDIYAKVGQDIGAGSETRDGLDSFIGLQFSMPLERRAARGKLDKSTAKIKQLNYLKQGLVESLSGSLHQAHAKYINKRSQAEVSLRRAEITKQLEQQEEKRAEQGASNIFLLNVRQENSAEAQVEAITDQLKSILAGIELLGRAYKVNELYSGELAR
tara:strand:- start:6763 stop:8202 length:1440 start_codon:yes stop_codon:yes gene_type:complete